MREDAQSQSLHYVHRYVVRDTIDYSCFPETVHKDGIGLYSVLPTPGEL